MPQCIIVRGQPLWLCSPSEAACLLQVSEEQVMNWIETGVLPFYPVILGDGSPAHFPRYDALCWLRRALQNDPICSPDDLPVRPDEWQAATMNRYEVALYRRFEPGELPFVEQDVEADTPFLAVLQTMSRLSVRKAAHATAHCYGDHSCTGFVHLKLADQEPDEEVIYV